MTQPAKQLEKYKRVLGFYQQNLEFLKVQLQAQNGLVAQKQQTVNQLRSQLASTQQSFLDLKPSPWELQMVSHLLANLELKIAAANQELNESERELESRRAAVRDQLSKIEALEKIVARTSDAIEHNRRRLEQIQLDERYLNTNFTG
jgi:flagellar biosynthesis chaperone FliJ